MTTAREFFETLPGRPDPERLRGVHNTYYFDIAGEGRWLVTVNDGNVTVDENPATDGADVSFTLSAETFDKLAEKKLNPMIAYMTGKLKVSGDVKVAMELQNLLP
jgi:putative sterol carrier protein